MIETDRDYVFLPRAEYERLTGIPKGAVEAVKFATMSIAKDLKLARERAGLTQEDLAKKIAKSQSMVSGAESGRIRVNERYIAAVLKACKLPKNWKGK